MKLSPLLLPLVVCACAQSQLVPEISCPSVMPNGTYVGRFTTLIIGMGWTNPAYLFTPAQPPNAAPACVELDIDDRTIIDSARQAFLLKQTVSIQVAGSHRLASLSVSPPGDGSTMSLSVPENISDRLD